MPKLRGPVGGPGVNVPPGPLSAPPPLGRLRIGSSDPPATAHPFPVVSRRRTAPAGCSPTLMSPSMAPRYTNWPAAGRGAVTARAGDDGQLTRLDARETAPDGP